MTDKKMKAIKKVLPEKTEQELKQEQRTHIASIALRPSSNAAAVMQEYGKVFGEQDVTELMVQIQKIMECLAVNDLSHCENMLLGQAHALQSMFTQLSRRAIAQENIHNIEVFMRMAMKAQNQCRMTLETLASIKNPPVVYVKQANIAHGHQQVNNGVSSDLFTEKNQILPNELLEVTEHENKRMDSGASSTAGRTDPAMATMDKSRRRKDS